MKIKELLEAIAADEAIVNEDLAGWDSRTVIGKHMGQRMAADRLTGLKEQYRKVISTSALAILPSGTPEQQAEFANLAETEADTVTVDASEMYMVIAKNVYPSVGRDQLFTPAQSGLMFQAVEDIAIKVGAPTALTYPIGTPIETVVRSVEETANLIRATIRKAIKDSLNVLYIEKQAVQKAMAARYNNETVPVVVINTTAEEAEGLTTALFTGRNVTVELSGNVTPESTTKTLLAAKKKLSKLITK